MALSGTNVGVTPGKKVPPSPDGENLVQYNKTVTSAEVAKKQSGSKLNRKETRKPCTCRHDPGRFLMGGSSKKDPGQDENPANIL